MKISVLRARIWQTAVRQKQWLIPLSIALFGTILLYRAIHNYKESIGYGMETEKILIARRELSQGHILAERDFAVMSVPRKYVPIGTLFPSDGAKAAGHAVLRPMAKGELVLWSAIDVEFSTTGPAQRIARGYRAISVQVDATTSIGHAIRPGDHVDLISTVVMPGDEQPTTLTLLQNITVLSVGEEQPDGEITAYSTVSLMVLPKEVGIIVHAERHGKLTLVLRNPKDQRTPANLPAVGMAQLVETAFRNSLQQERNDAVEVIRGGKLSFDQ